VDPGTRRNGGSGAGARHWRVNLQLLVALLAVWFVASFGLGIFFVEPLNEVHLGGFPLGFWFAQQGSILIFIVLILAYALAMDRLDARYQADRPRGPVDDPLRDEPE